MPAAGLPWPSLSFACSTVDAYFRLLILYSWTSTNIEICVQVIIVRSFAVALKENPERAPPPDTMVSHAHVDEVLTVLTRKEDPVALRWEVCILLEGEPP